MPGQPREPLLMGSVEAGRGVLGSFLGKHLVVIGIAVNRDRDRYRYRYRNRFRDVLSIELFDPDPDSESCQNHFSHTRPGNPGF